MTNWGLKMYKFLIPLIAVGLSACGGGETTDPNNFIISTPTGTPLTATQAKSFGQTTSNGPFTLASGSSSFTLQRTNQSTAHQSTYNLTVNGVTYNLTPTPGNSATSTNNSFKGTVGGTTATLFLNENRANASIANVQLGTGGASEQLFGIVGSATPTATLTSLANATYTGIGEVSIDRSNGAFDDAPSSVANLSANFTNGTMSGSINVADDSTNDNGGAFDITGGTVGLSGTISGNSFTLTPDYSGMTVTGVTNIVAQPIEGGFYGTNAENAVGVGLSLGQSSVANDVVIYTRVQTTKN